MEEKSRPKFEGQWEMIGIIKIFNIGVENPTKQIKYLIDWAFFDFDFKCKRMEIA
jgi:hypothetical protein